MPIELCAIRIYYVWEKYESNKHQFLLLFNDVGEGSRYCFFLPFILSWLYHLCIMSSDFFSKKCFSQHKWLEEIFNNPACRFSCEFLSVGAGMLHIDYLTCDIFFQRLQLIMCREN